MITLIFASTENGVIGNNGKLPWPPLKGELKLFKETTINNTVIMGRKTFQSLPVGPLPDRINVVLTRKITFLDRWNSFKFNMTHFNTKLVYVSEKSVNKFLDNFLYMRDAFIIGGAEIFKRFESRCDAMIWTIVNGDYDGDTSFKPSQIMWQKISERHFSEYKILKFRKKF